jgi:uncharacterized membrane protein
MKLIPLVPVKDVMDKGRFDAFTDGVFAVAITLMALEIHIPDLKTVSDASMRGYISTLGGPLFTYLISFGTVGLIWLNHHATFAPVKNVNRTVNALNLCLLAVVCFVPFPTALVSRYGPLPSSVALYGATLTLMSIAFFVVWQYAVRSDPEAPPVPRSVLITGGIGIVFYVAGTLIAFLAPRVALWIFILITIYYSMPGIFNLRREEQLRQRAS